ncbi:MAG TPA: flavodoxin-dependent (E)-4-hydroxy-3-methylbut-2-enyl-diphosphate synthase, partial [Chitinophagaceae bacterium]|nr:flavodoxin-dependent (E)-4-hydroxy-3-methylbut-2-enyl-diphosphate synthase [Chitinophagaceae bacterium]
EIPVCKDIVKRYEVRSSESGVASQEAGGKNQKSEIIIPPVLANNLPYSPFEYKRRQSFSVDMIGGKHVPAVIADLSKIDNITVENLQSVGYSYDAGLDKWNILDTAADYIFIGNRLLDFELPGTLKIIVYADAWKNAEDKTKYYPIYGDEEYLTADAKSNVANFVMVDCFSEGLTDPFLHIDVLGKDKTVVLCLSSQHSHPMPAVRRMFMELMERKIKNPVVVIIDSNWQTADEHLIHFATEAGALLLDGMGDGVCFGMTSESYKAQKISTKDTGSPIHNQPSTINSSGRNYLQSGTVEQFINNTAFSILQATRTRISKTEYISCPSCGRTLFDLQETTAKIRAVTNHLKGVKIAIMGCIVNGPGEMADADFGYVGSGPGRITLYKGKEVVKKNVPSEVAVEELVNLLKENFAWVESK